MTGLGAFVIAGLVLAALFVVAIVAVFTLNRGDRVKSLGVHPPTDPPSPPPYDGSQRPS